MVCVFIDMEGSAFRDHSDAHLAGVFGDVNDPESIVQVVAVEQSQLDHFAGKKSLATHNAEPVSRSVVQAHQAGFAIGPSHGKHDPRGLVSGFGTSPFVGVAKLRGGANDSDQQPGRRFGVIHAGPFRLPDHGRSLGALRHMLIQFGRLAEHARFRTPGPLWKLALEC